MAFDTGHALVLGVGEYQFMSEYNVPVALQDADAVAAVLQDATLCGYPSTQVQKLTGPAATRTAILARLDELATQLKEVDTLFLFFVGHGVYGTDGNYYLTTYDTKLQGKQVVAGTGVSEHDLLGRLRKISAKRMLLIINSCHAGQLSPNFDLDASLSSEAPPPKLAEALLSTGEGRITITACRPEQKSWIGSGKLSIFSNALVNGLKGAAPNSNGYIGAFGLYEYLYYQSKDTAADLLGVTQEPELTVIKGVGPFPVALCRGASNLGEFSEALPQEDTATRVISPQQIQRSAKQYSAVLVGDGAIAQGEGAKAVGKGGILVDGNLTGNIVIGSNNKITGS